MPIRKTWVTVVGWLLVLVGIGALILPGPGLLMLLAGLVVLSQEYTWAERRVEPVKRKAFDVAKEGVATYPRILMSGLAALVVVAVGVVFWIDPEIPTFDTGLPWIGEVGPDLPFGGWPTGVSVVLSGFVAIGLLVYSIRRWRAEAVRERRERRERRRTRSATPVADSRR